MEITGKAQGQVLIIEGVDGVGKTHFIQNLCDFLKGEGVFSSILTPEEIAKYKHKRGGRAKRRKAEQTKFDAMISGTRVEEVITVTKENPNGMLPFSSQASIAKEVMRYGAPFSVYVANIRDSSPETRNFYQRLLAGEITDEVEIVKEYLQAHFDLHNYIQTLREMHDLVIVDRALPSFFVSQVRACGQSYAERNYRMLLEKTGQNNYATLWVLQASDAKILQRGGVRGHDAQGEKLDAKRELVKAAYDELLKSGDWRHGRYVNVESDSAHDYLGLFTEFTRSVISYTRRFSLLR